MLTVPSTISLFKPRLEAWAPQVSISAGLHPSPSRSRAVCCGCCVDNPLIRERQFPH